MGHHMYAINLSVAILVCDIPLPAVIANYGDYTTLFTNLLRKAEEQYSATTHKVDLTVASFDVMQQQYPANMGDFDAYVLTGSKFSAYEDVDWIRRLKEFVRQVDATSTAKLLGICFGHQIIAEALGGKVIKNPAGWEVGWTEVQINERGRGALNTDKRTMRVQQMHQDHVVATPEGFEVISSTDKSAVQAMIKADRCLTIQGHPEFLPGVVEEVVKARKASGVFNAEMADLVLAQVDKPVDDVWFATKMIGFLVGTLPRD